MEQGSPMPLVERDAELALVPPLVERTLAGDGALLTFVGSPGIGKTRLLRATRQQAEDAGLSVLVARGAELERELELGVVRQLFEPVLARASKGERARLLAGAAALAAPLVGDGAGGAPPPSADPAFPALHGLHWLTANMAAERPLLIVVDDAHWADAPSLRFLAYLAGRLDGVRALVASAARLAEPGAAPAQLDALIAHPEARVVRPSPLSPAGVATLVSDRLDGTPDAEFVAACEIASGGNPFLVVELLAALVADGIHPTAAGAAQVLELGPESVLRAVLARLARMPPDCAALARSVAVLGDRVELGWAASLAGLDEGRAARAADALVAAEVFDRERTLGFIHPMVRAAIYEDVLPHQRAAAHLRAARALDEIGAEPGRVAVHLLLSEPSGDRWVVDVLRRAAHRALARAAPESAVAYLERALVEPPAPELRSHVIRELGSAELRVGSPRGLEHLSAALPEIDEPAARAHAALELGRALLMAGRRDAAEVMHRTAGEVHGDDPDLAARLEIEAIGVERIFGIVPEARRERLARLREEVKPGSAAHRLVLAALAFESAIAGSPAVEAARLAAEAFGDGRLLAEEGPESPSVVMAANALTFCDRFDRAGEIFERGLSEARTRGSALGAAYCSCFGSPVALRVGVVGEAEALAREAIDLAGSPGLEILRPIALAFLIEALIERGELGAAEDELERGGESGAGDLNGMMLVATRGWLRVASGAPRRGLADLLEAGERLQAAGVTNAVPVFWRSRAALALLALDDPRRAARLANEEVGVARRFGAPSTLGTSLRAAGLVAGGEEGLDLLRESVRLLEDSPARLEHAHSLVALGGGMRRAGRRAEAREPLAAGLALARRCGAIALAERAYQELTATGARPRKILRSGVDALTAGEARVAEMAAAGTSNRDIAQALFVTVRTVETHLSHAYLKLDIGSRTELATALRGSEYDRRR